MRDWQKEAKEILSNFKEMPWRVWDDAIEFLLDWQNEKSDLGIIDCDLVDELVRHRLEHGGYQSVICLLDGISGNINQSYYRLDGYGNLEIIENSDIECWLDDIANDRL